MKKITLLFLATLILFSCSSDDPLTDNGGNSKPQRRIAKIEKLYSENSYNYSSTEIFTYDNQGRWIRSDYSANDNYLNVNHISTLSYSGNTIRYSGDNFEEDVFELKNNIIVSRGDNPRLDDYHYSNNYLTQIGIGTYANFEYTNGNLTKVIEGKGESHEDIYNIAYTDYPDKMGFCAYEVSYNDTAIEVNPANILYQFGYFGKKSKNLIESIDSTWGDKIYYSYEFDNQGYVTKIIERYVYQGKTETTTYKIYYE